jgi:putative zinc finger/helix-turn-helix YgiT family protein
MRQQGLQVKQPNGEPLGENNPHCLRCGSAAVESAYREVEFDYGGREKPFRVKATFPLTTCRECGFTSVEGDGETLQHEAACRHLGVMTPAEIQTLREKMNLAQKDLAELTGLGVASISRWERGLVIQNKACDQLLYLLTFPENVERLQRRKAVPPGDPPKRPNRVAGQWRNGVKDNAGFSLRCCFSEN